MAWSASSRPLWGSRIISTARGTGIRLPGQLAPLKRHLQHLMVVVRLGQRERQRRAAVVHPYGALGQVQMAQRRVVGGGK